MNNGNRQKRAKTRNPKVGMQQDRYVSVTKEEDGLELKEIINAIRGGKWVIALVTAGVLLIALLYAFLAKPIYQTNGLIQIQQENQPSSASDVLSFFLPMAEPAQAEISIMTSRAVLEPVVKKLHLNVIVEASGLPIISHIFGSAKVSEISVKQLRVPDDWKDQKLVLQALGDEQYSLESPSGVVVLHGVVGKVATADGGRVKILINKLAVSANKSFDLTRLYNQEAIADLQDNLNASQIGNDTGIVQLTLDGHNPTQIKNVLNAIETQYINQNVEAMASQAKKSLAFIHKELPQLKQRLDAAQGLLTQFMQKNGAVDLDQQSQALLQELSTLESQLGEITLAEAAMRQRYTQNYPGYKALKSQEVVIRNQIDDIQGQITALPKKEQSYLDLTQHVQAYQQLYTALLAKVQDLQIAQAGTVGSARIIDQAVEPVDPIAPRKVLTTALGFILGVFIGIFVVFFRRALSRSIEDAAVLEQAFNLPVYGVIPHSAKQASLIRKAYKEPNSIIPLLINADPSDPVVESIRSMRTVITFALKDHEERIISIGGCAPSAGKSFISINLAHVAANAENRVLLIDADMRRGHMERYLNGVKSPGLSDVLNRNAELRDVIQQSPYSENVDFIPSGNCPQNPFELLSRPDLQVVVGNCAGEYDLVIIDVPPILSVADGALIARLTTTNFLVVRSGHQHIQEVRMALSRFEQNGAHVLGFILNDLSAQAQGYTYGKYGGAYKRYRYESNEK